jgi:hypothetical protein
VLYLSPPGEPKAPFIGPQREESEREVKGNDGQRWSSIKASEMTPEGERSGVERERKGDNAGDDSVARGVRHGGDGWNQRRRWLVHRRWKKGGAG